MHGGDIRTYIVIRVQHGLQSRQFSFSVQFPHHTISNFSTDTAAYIKIVCIVYLKSVSCKKSTKNILTSPISMSAADLGGC